MKLILKRKESNDQSDELEADAVLVIDHNGAVECAKNRIGPIGEICTHETPEALLKWMRFHARESHE